MKKKIIILGQSNSGKSSLYNLLLESKESIVYNQKGVTRDIKKSSAYIKDIEYEIIDTGGIGDYRLSDPFLKEVEKKVYSILPKVDVILFIIDPQTSYLENYSLIEKLRKFEKKIFFIINKIDLKINYSKIDDIEDKLRYQNCIRISVLQKINICKLKNQLYMYLQKDKVDKSQIKKSSFLLQKKKLYT